MISGSTTATFISKLTLGSTSYTVNHALSGSVVTQVYNKTTGEYATVGVDRVDANNVTITVNVALAVDHIVMCTFIGTEPA